MAYVNVPNDLSKIKTKLAFNLTKRQLICFGGAAVVGIPLYLFTRGALGNTAALFLMLAVMLPAFLLAMYERDGLPLEKVVRNIVRAKYLRPGRRPYRTENIYAPFARKEEPIAKSVKQRPGRADRPSRGRGTLSAQQTIPYVRMLKDGVCQLPGGLFTKTLAYEDINYSVASTEDQSAIFNGWSAFLNYFDASIPFQLSFINRRSHSSGRYEINIPPAHDEFDSIRGEFTGMLKGQVAKSNNGIDRAKYITFGVPADDLATARPRLERVEADVLGNFKRLGVQAQPLDGRERLAVLHGQTHPGSQTLVGPQREAFHFSWADVVKTGQGTKEAVAPFGGFDFSRPRTFRVGRYWGAASYLQIMASDSEII